MQQFDADAVSFEIHRLEFDILKLQQGRARFARDLQFGHPAEAELVAIEGEGAWHVRHADSDVRDAQDRH